MGGIWLYIDARLTEDIYAKYPELKVFDEPPDFLSAEDRRSIRSELHFAIDDPPAGYLAELVKASERRGDR